MWNLSKSGYCSDASNNLESYEDTGAFPVDSLLADPSALMLLQCRIASRFPLFYDRVSIDRLKVVNDS